MHGGQCLQQLAGFIVAIGGDGVGQVAIGNAFGGLLALLQGPDDGARDRQAHQRTQRNGHQRAHTQQHLAGLGQGGGVGLAFGQLCGHGFTQVVEGLEVFVGQRAQVLVHQGGHVGLTSAAQFPDFVELVVVGLTGCGNRSQKALGLVALHQRLNALDLGFHALGRCLRVGSEFVHVVAVDGLEECLGTHPVQADVRRPVFHQGLLRDLLRGDALTGTLQAGDVPHSGL